ncbi:hypothetical protein [Neorhizobium sp. NCHU2750]|uniref:hypothetical protein n=1 Tax=Neorhizobium sp. NCHU2750 TaxID=1825976 RepID=UPI000EB6D65A|nr:hypothetical protein NCHU2750_01830 [Neorhizobium sp. NCHU2750]
MGGQTHVYTIGYVAVLIGENLELIQEIASNSDNIDYGEMIHAHDGSEEGITTFTDRGVESLKEFLADIRTWEGGDLPLKFHPAGIRASALFDKPNSAV